MRGSRRPVDRSRTLRAALAAISLALLASGTLEVHSSEHYGGEDQVGSARSVFVPEAAHPGAPPHCEPGAESERPACAACLQSLRTLETSTTAAAIDCVEVVTEIDSAAGPVFFQTPRAGACRGRAPPLLSA
jgi:hypothetical protein